MNAEFLSGDRALLLSIAKRSLEHGLAHGTHLTVSPDDYPPALQSQRATFVTLKMQGELRGCIGGLEPQWPLVEDVARHAFAAGFHDPRFPPLSKTECQSVALHIAVLSPRKPLDFSDEAELIASLRPGIDGLVIARGSRRATFLPAVWESLRDPAQFLAELKRKAGIPPASAPERAEIYHTESFGDDPVHPG